MKLLAKLFKTLLCLVLVAVVCIALTGLAWWMGWPLATGAVILLGLLAAVLLFCVGKTLLRWRNKRTFVQSVLREQRKLEGEPSGITGSDLTDVWREGMAVFDGSPLRVSLNPRYRQPWFLTLDDTVDVSGGSSLFDAFSRRVPAENPDCALQKNVPPLIWHFLPSAVLLQVPESGNDNGPWESTLTLLAQDRRKMAMRGIVLLVSARELQQLPPDALRTKGQRLRRRLQQVMLTLNHRFPVYVCVQDIESLPGMIELSSRLPVSVTDAPLGCLLSASLSPTQAVAQATDTACFRLREAMQDAAVGEVLPHGDELLALETLSELSAPLQSLLEQGFRDLPHQVSPLLRGVFFCHAQAGKTFHFTTEIDESQALNLENSKAHAADRSTEGRPRYVTELFSHSIPEDPVPVRHLNSRFALYSSTRLACMTAWLVLLCFVCGVLAVNTVYQHHVLVSHTHDKENVTHNKMINTLYAQMSEIRYLEKAAESWPLPLMGQDMLGMVQGKLKQHFLHNTYTDMLAPMVNTLQSVLLSPDLARDKDKLVEVVRQLRWLCGAVAERMEHGTTKGLSMAFPLTRANETLWTPVTGELMLSALNWTSNEADLLLFSRHLQRVLTQGLTRDSGNVLRTLMQSTEPMTSGTRMCLSRYWPNLANSADDVCVPGRYTRTGYEQQASILNDILIITDNAPELQQTINRFREEYNREYISAWYTFITKCNTQWMNSLDGEAFTAYGELKSVADLPHVQALKHLSAELTPIQENGTPPAWLDGVTLLDTMLTVAISSDAGKSSLWDVVLSLVQSSQKTLTVLRENTKDTAHLRQTLQSIPHARLYLEEILHILRQSGNPAQALALAGPHFSNSDVSMSPFTEAEKHLDAVLAPVAGNDTSPGRSLMTGLLDFARQATIVQAARELQHQWEAEVLSSPVNLYRPTDIPAMFGETGVITTFMNTRLKPFVRRQGADFVPAAWQRVPFPFTTDFLRSISRGEAVAAAPARAAYSVLLRSQPTLVNIEARERPDATTVTLQCTGKSTQLVNRNYPQNQTFDYVVEECGEAVLKVDFPSVHLQRQYANFADMLEEFQYGERKFGREDFPESADRLAAILVNDITVRLLPDNVTDVLSRKNNSMPALQDRITYAW